MQFDQLKRREFITLLGGAAARGRSRPGRSRPAMPVIGYYQRPIAGSGAPILAAFRRGLKETGYVDGPEHRHRIPLVRRVETISSRHWRPSCSSAGGCAGRQPTGRRRWRQRQRPRPFQSSSPADYDPVEIGLVASLNRPGGNATGVISSAPSLGQSGWNASSGVPNAGTIAVLVNPNTATPGGR